jgi:hypothetical protein
MEKVALSATDDYFTITGIHHLGAPIEEEIFGIN